MPVTYNILQLKYEYWNVTIENMNIEIWILKYDT